MSRCGKVKLMADLATLEQGFEPWCPTEDTEPVEVFDRYNRPTSGVIRQHGVSFVFWCAVGHEQEVDMWGYAHVSDHEADALVDAEEDKFVALFAEAASRPTIKVALAGEGRGIFGSTSLETGGTFFHSGTPEGAKLVKRAFEYLQEQMRGALDVAGSWDPAVSLAAY